MEIVGCAASVSQLLVYIALSSGRLEKLCAELKDGHSTYREEESNISLLLRIIQRLSRQHIENEDSILPVLIAISTLACQALHLLRPNKVLGINWTPITAHEKIKSAFQSLDRKRTLLHLYISQTHHEVLVDLREIIKTSNMSSSKRPMYENPDTSSKGPSDDANTDRRGNTSVPTGVTQERTKGPRVEIKNSTNSGLHSIGSGHNPPEGDFKMDGFTQTSEGVFAMANQEQVSEATIIAYARIRNPVQTAAGTVPPVAHAHMAAPAPAATTFTQRMPAQPSTDREPSPSSPEVSDPETPSAHDTAQSMGQHNIQAQQVYAAPGDRRMNDSGISVTTQPQEEIPLSQQQSSKRDGKRGKNSGKHGIDVEKKDGQYRYRRPHMGDN